MNTENKELEPCPFCGGKARIKAINKKDVSLTIWCECEKCTAKAGGNSPIIEKEDNFLEAIRNAQELAIKRWNNRV